jgi:hypothetical protein
MADINEERRALVLAAQAFLDQATSYLLETVPAGVNWEDEQPTVDGARTAAGDVIDQMNDEMGAIPAYKAEKTKERFGWWVAIGRVADDDEDSVAWIRCGSEEQAIENLKRVLVERLKENDHSGEEGYEYDEDEEPIYTTWTFFCGDSRPEIFTSPHF